MNDFQRYLIHEFVEDYKDGYLSRRELLRRVLYITGGVASAATILAALGCGGGAAEDVATGVAPTATTPAGAGASPAGSPPASPAGTPADRRQARSPLSVPADDPAVTAEDITFPGRDVTVMAYQARPSDAAGPLPPILVCHENRGLVEHIRDVTRRFAKAGDLLLREGGTDAVADPSQIPGILSNADPARYVGYFRAAIAHYAGQPDLAVPDRVGMTGYCFGGGITWRAATQLPELTAAVPFYGPPPPLDLVPNIRAAVFGVYSSDPNDFANNGRDELEAALQAAGVTYEIKVYPDTQHAFHNDTGPRWNPQQAQAAWQDTLAWFARYLEA
ncbi:MAG: dienelactone hydrolase family protein [Sphaerobacter sp.]|nr:dienelactone hydrolase family protein [Sphaerobacter sp.]